MQCLASSRTWTTCISQFSYINSNGKFQEFSALLALLALIALLVGVSSVGKRLPIRIERLNCSLAYRRFLITINYCFYYDFPFN